MPNKEVPMLIRKRVVIKGTVQGMSYLKKTQKIASIHGLKGWIRSLTDGTVEACFEGSESAVGAVISWCFVGSKQVRVEEVVVRQERYRGRYRGFHVRIGEPMRLDDAV